MAPKGGKGGGGRGGLSLSSSCPNPFPEDSLGHTGIPYFVAYCVFFVVTLVILIVMGKTKKKHPNAKRLLGPIYVISLLFSLLGYALIIIARMLMECDTTPFESYYQWEIAFTIFFELGNYLLLVLAVFNVNNILRQHHGYNPSYFKFIYGAILVVMGALTCAYIGLWDYNYYTYYARWRDLSYGTLFALQGLKLDVAYRTLFLVSVLIASALAGVTLLSMRSRGAPRGNLTGWAVAFFVSMFLWTLFSLVSSAANLDAVLATLNNPDSYNEGMKYEGYVAMGWLTDIFQSVSWISLIGIAKSTALDHTPVTNEAPQAYNTSYPPQQTPYAPVQQQQPMYSQPTSYTVHNGPPPPQPQQYYYQQQPMYNGQPTPHVAEVK